MKKLFENVTRITEEKDYIFLKEHINNLCEYGLINGHYDNFEDNEIKREVCRLTSLITLYEQEFKMYGFR